MYVIMHVIIDYASSLLLCIIMLSPMITYFENLFAMNKPGYKQNYENMAILLS